MVKRQAYVLVVGRDYPNCANTITVEGASLKACYQNIRKARRIIRMYGSYCRCPDHKYKHAGAVGEGSGA